MSSTHSTKDRCIALAALFQASHLVTAIAHHGSADQRATEASIYSLLQTDTASVEEVFGGVSGVSFGLQQLRSQLQSGGRKELYATRYAITLLHLERKLRKQKKMLDKIGDGIQIASQRLEHFPLMHPNILAQLADLYSTTISTLQPRIMVQGEPLHLENQSNINLIRSLLLAGVRAAILWRQCGGNKLQVLLGRKQLARMSEQLLQQLEIEAIEAP